MASPALPFAFDASGQYFASTTSSNSTHKVEIISAPGAKSPKSWATEYTLPEGLTVQSLAWASLVKLKRNKSDGASESATANTSEIRDLPSFENTAIAIGTNKGDIIFFSPAQSTVLFTLSGVHSSPVILLAPTYSLKLWSYDSTGKISVWNLATKKCSNIIQSPKSDVKHILPTIQGIVIASDAVYLANASNPNECNSIYKSANPILSLIRTVDPEIVFTSSQNERLINIVSTYRKKAIGGFSAQSNAQQLFVSDDGFALGALTEEGGIEIFDRPLTHLVGSASLIFKLQSKNSAKLTSASFRSDFISMVLTEDGKPSVIEQVRWRDPFGNLLNGTVELSTSVNGEFITSLTSKPEFSAKNTGTDIEATEFSLSEETPESFAIKLSDSLKTNDDRQLDICLTVKDMEFIETAVKRIHSPMASTLVKKLAEKVEKNPAEAVALSSWIKWIMVTHGGYLVAMPDLAKPVSSLRFVLSSKLKDLPKLLALQGRIQMLRTQMQLRREIVAKGINEAAAGDESESEAESETENVDEAALIINGEEDFDDYVDEDEADTGSQFIELEAEESGDEDESEDEESGIETRSDDAMELDVEEEAAPVQTKVVKKRSSHTNGKSKSRR